MNIFEHGGDYAAAYAGVPVSDLIARMGYKTEGYRDLYSADFHIGKTAFEDVEEYRRRSPSVFRPRPCFQLAPPPGPGPGTSRSR